MAWRMNIWEVFSESVDLHQSRQQQKIANKKSKRSKRAVAERWKTGAEDYVFILGEWRMENSSHLWRSIMNLPLRQTTNRTSPRANSRRIKTDSEVVWLPPMIEECSFKPPHPLQACTEIWSSKESILCKLTNSRPKFGLDQRITLLYGWIVPMSFQIKWVPEDFFRQNWVLNHCACASIGQTSVFQQ